MVRAPIVSRRADGTVLAQVQEEIGWEEIRNTRQTTLERWFVSHAAEVTMCDD